MSLENEYGSEFDKEEIDMYGKRMLEKYGKFACKCAAKLDNTNLGSKSKSSYKTQIRQIFSELNEEIPEPERVVRIISSHDKKPSTKNTMLVAMKKYYNSEGVPEKSEELEKLAESEGLTQKQFNSQMEVDEWITEDEFKRLREKLFPSEEETIKKLRSGDKTWVMNVEHKAISCVLYYTGCRVGEICKRDKNDFALELDDIYFDENLIEVYRLKKGGEGVKRQMRLVPQECIDVINEYLEWKDNDSDYLFNFTTRTAQNRIKEVDEAYKFFFGEWKHMKDLTPHKFRHGRVTAIAKHSGLDKAGEYVDHSSTKITKGYRHLDTTEQREMLPEESSNESPELIEQIKDMSDDELEEIKNVIDEVGQSNT